MFRGYVWCTFVDGLRFVLDPAILADLKTVQKEFLALDRLVFSTVDDVRWTLDRGWCPRKVFNSNIWTLELPVRLLNKRQSSAGTKGDRINRWRLAYHFASSARTPLDVAAQLDAKLEATGLMDTAVGEHRALVPILTTESPKFDVEEKEVRADVRAWDKDASDANRRLRDFIGPFANLDSDADIHARFAQEGCHLADLKVETVEKAMEGDVSRRTYLRLDALRDRLQLLPKLRALREVLGGLNDEGELEAEVDPLGTCTGRLDGQSPRLIGLNRSLRHYFRAEPGRVLVGRDYSQIQVRILADYSRDENLLEAFKREEDIHQVVAATIFGGRPSNISPAERKKAKAVSHGVNMGMGAETLADYATKACNVATTVDEARGILDDYFEIFPQVQRFRRRLFERARDEGLVRTRAGRRCQLADFEELHPGQVLAYLLQMAEADILKTSINLLYERLLPQAGNIVCILHDEIIVEADQGRVEKVSGLLKETMTDAANQHLEHCPAGESEVVIGQSWSELA